MGDLQRRAARGKRARALRPCREERPEPRLAFQYHRARESAHRHSHRHPAWRQPFGCLHPESEHLRSGSGRMGRRRAPPAGPLAGALSRLGQIRGYRLPLADPGTVGAPGKEDLDRRRHPLPPCLCHSHGTGNADRHYRYPGPECFRTKCPDDFYPVKSLWGDKNWT